MIALPGWRLRRTSELVALRSCLPALFRLVALDTLLHGLERAGRARSKKKSAELAPVLESAEAWSARLRLPNTCLYRALGRFWLLARDGDEPATFCLGVPSSGSGPGHAWVEVHGEPFMEREYPAFIRTYSYTSHGT